MASAMRLQLKPIALRRLLSQRIRLLFLVVS